MFVVTVVFDIKPDCLEDFRPAMLKQARVSLAEEEGCHQFDVAADPGNPNRIFLYELYTDKAAFETHLGTAHFKSFDATVAPFVESKAVATYDRLWPED